MSFLEYLSNVWPALATIYVLFYAMLGIRWRKVGGIWFFRLDSLRASFCVSNKSNA